MKRFILFSVHFLLISLFLSAQDSYKTQLSGTILTEKGEAIPFANISVKDSGTGTTADDAGRFQLTIDEPGEFVLIAQALGYKRQEKIISPAISSSDPILFNLAPDVFNLEQVVVTATRTAHYVKDVPIRTEIVTSKALEKKNATNLFEALDGIPGIRVESQCQSCNFTQIRMQGLGAEHTQILMNGQPMYSGLASVYGLQQLSTIDIEKIEVVKGAGSALYGSGAVAGAINVVSKEPSNIPETTIGIQAGNFGTQRFDLNSSIRNEKGNIALQVFAQRYNEGIIDETGAGTTQDEVRQADGISDRVSTNLTNTGFSLFINDLMAKNDQLIVRGKSIVEQRDGGILDNNYYLNPYTDGTESIKTNRYEGELTYKRRFSKKLNFTSSFNYVNHARQATNDSYLSDYIDTHEGESPDVLTMRPYVANEQLVALTGSMSYKIKRHSLVLGFQTFYDRLTETGKYVVVDEENPFYGASYLSTSNKQAAELGIFLQDEWSVNEHLVVVPGIRFDVHRSNEQYTSSEQVFTSALFPETHFQRSAINPRVAIKYQLSDKLTLRANAGTGFRAPYGFSEDLHLCSGSPRVWKSSNLNPETSVSFNLSADYYGYKYRISSNIFRTNLKDKIAFTTASAGVASLGYDYEWVNMNDAFVQGIELSVIRNFNYHLEAGIDITLNDGRYQGVREEWAETEYAEQSKFISRFPTSTVNTRLEWAPNNWSFIVMANYQGSMYIDYFNEDINPEVGDQTQIIRTNPFVLVNLRVSHTIKQFRIHGGINNLLNYVQPIRYLDDPAFLYAPIYGTMFYLGVNVNLYH
mgnify:CR=1 FL=1